MKNNFYHDKYIKYKNKYLLQQNINNNNINFTEDYNKNILFVNDILSSSNYIWTFDIDLLENNNEHQFMTYEIDNKYNKHFQNYYVINTPNTNDVYTFIWYNNIFGINVNMLSNIFSKPFKLIIHNSVILWLNLKIEETNLNIFKTSSVRLTQPGICINANLIKNNQKPKISKFNFDTLSVLLNSTSNYKIHMMVDLQFLFWTIETIIKNNEKFIINLNNETKPLFSHFKIHTDFYNYSVLSNKKAQCNYDKNLYKDEYLYRPNIVFYQYDDVDVNITKICFEKLIIVLRELFPNELNISSNKYSKFTFKINNNLFLCIGDGIDKFNSSNEYTIPIEYNDIINKCSLQQNKFDCDNLNLKSYELSNHKLCDFDNDICKINNINSINYMVKKNNNSINNIYKEIGYLDNVI